MNRTKRTTQSTDIAIDTNHRRTTRTSFAAASWLSSRFLLTVTLLGIILSHRLGGADASVVHTYSKLGQKVTSSTLQWESYSAVDMKQLEYAIQGGKYISEEEHYPIYVCRVTIDGVQTSGHTEKHKQAHLCVVSYLKEVKKYERFDVLVNKGHLGKVAWKPWRKFSVGIPLGAISVDDYSYIARRRVNHLSNDEHMGADYTLGRFDPTLGLGKILVVEDHREREYDEGEVLIETEPFRYELRDIKLDNIRTDVRVNTTELARGILENKYDKSNLIETVLSYSFDHVQYWGIHEGVARGLATKVYETDEKQSSTPPAEINWGLKYSEKCYETKSVSSTLPPGTAINVTLMGNYVTLEAPYRAKLFAFYYGSKESVSRNISAEVRKGYLKEVKLEYSPVYWIENGTFVPTTTTTTTSTTTHPTTTGSSSNSDLKPMHEPPVVLLSDIGRSVVPSDSKPSLTSTGGEEADVNENIIPNESRENYAENLKHMKGAANPGTSHSTRLYCWTNSILILLILLTLRVFG